MAQPRYINPLLAQTSQADADLVSVIYDGLFARDNHGVVVPRMAEGYEVSDGGKTYTVHLRKDITWHDGEPFTAADVAYTIQTLQDPTFKSPLRQSWLGVDVATPDDFTVVFTLKKEYFSFLENLTLGILPKHIWQGVTSDKFLLTEYNLAPIGTGAYRFKASEKDGNGSVLSIDLEAYSKYFLGEAYVKKLAFYFYDSKEALMDAYNKKQVDGIFNIQPNEVEKIAATGSTSVDELDFPRTFSVFWNITKSAPLADAKVRQAIALAVDREALVQKVLGGKGTPAYGPLLPFMRGYVAPGNTGADLAAANKILDDAGWKQEGDVRMKNGEKLTFTMVVPDWSELLATGEVVKEQLAALGIEVIIDQKPAADIQQNILKNREYQALLFGQAPYLQSDPYSFWHSSQKGDTGLNFSLFENKEADETLDTLRTTLDTGRQDELYKKFQEIFQKENPALMLYSPKYLYVQNADISGFDTNRINTPAGRLSNIKNWYIYTDRAWGEAAE
jgi:peptide/nickel transport system substrate-binding protein